MSTFYLLPPDSTLADHLADCLMNFLPGIDLSASERLFLIGKVMEGIEKREVFLIHRHELPPGERTEQNLIDGYGAAHGDEVVEVRLTARAGEFASRRWRIGPIAQCT